MADEPHHGNRRSGGTGEGDGHGEAPTSGDGSSGDSLFEDSPSGASPGIPRRAYDLGHLAPQVRARLADVLSTRSDEIHRLWCEALRHSASPLYAALPEHELETGLRLLFEGDIAFLRQGQPETLSGLVSALARVRFAQGFTPSDLEGAIGAMRGVVLPIVIREFCDEPDLLADVISAVMMIEELSSVRISEAYQEVTAAEIQAAQDEALRAEREKVAFCREMARVATHEKLILCDHVDLPARPDVDPLSVASPRDVRDARHAAAALATETEWGTNRSYALQLCIGEAGTNAIRHAGTAAFQVWRDADRAISFRIADTGPGIDFCRIPAALRSGFSTGSSLGMGFTLMLELADCIHLATDHSGTTLLITLKPTK